MVYYIKPEGGCKGKYLRPGYRKAARGLGFFPSALAAALARKASAAQRSLM